MRGPERGPGVDEFDAIERLLRPLSQGAPEALGLLDDAAVIPARPGFDLVVSKDAMVEGVHFLSEDPLDLVARKLLRVNLSDLAAKAADPYAYLLAAAWPARCGWPERTLFVQGLRRDQDLYDVKLIGGDTSSTPGPLALSLTIFGWTPAGAMVKRSGARPGDLVLASGTIGDGVLGLRAAQGGLGDLAGGAAAWLADRYRLPQPRLGLRQALRSHASAAVDVSDGLVADASHIAEASGVALSLDLDRLPLSPAAQAWLATQPERAAALAELATGGDDYEIALTVAPAAATALIAQGRDAGVALTQVGEVSAGRGVRVSCGGGDLALDRTGWRHG